MLNKKNVIYLIPIGYIMFSMSWTFISEYFFKLNDYQSEEMWRILARLITPVIVSTFLFFFASKYQKLLEKEKETSRRLSTLINSMPDFVGFKDGNGRWLEINNFAKEMFEIKDDFYKGKTDEEILGDNYPCINSDNETWKRKKIYQTEEIFNFAGKEKKVFDVIKVPLFYPNGARKGLVAIGRDITEKKEIEKTLQKSEERYRTIVEHSPDGLLIHKDGEIAYANKKALEMFGYKEINEIIGKNIIDFAHPDYKEIVKERTKLSETVNETEPIEEKLIKENGDPFLAEVRTVKIPFSYENSILVIISDKTEKKEMEKALKESEENFRLITENTNDLICLINRDLVTEYASPSYEKILQLPVKEYVGSSAEFYVHEDDRERIRETFIEALERKEAFTVEFKKVKKSPDDYIYVETTATPILDDSGEVEMFVCVSRDQTGKKQTEEMLRKADKLNIVGELAAGIAHEIRNPLTSLRGFVQLLQITAKENEQYYQIMLSELDRINFIVSEFLVLAKPQMKLFQQKNIIKLVDDTTKFINSEALMNGVEIEIEEKEEEIMVDCDENQLKQVFMNVIKNAIEAMQNGGKLIIRTKKIADGKALIQFIDEGIGIEPERLEKLGEPFFTTKEKGTGLGMTVSMKIIKAHKGEMTFESEVNKGTIVNISLPLANK